MLTDFAVQIFSCLWRSHKLTSTPFLCYIKNDKTYCKRPTTHFAFRIGNSKREAYPPNKAWFSSSLTFEYKILPDPHTVHTVGEGSRTDFSGVLPNLTDSILTCPLVVEASNAHDLSRELISHEVIIRRKPRKKNRGGPINIHYNPNT